MTGPHYQPENAEGSDFVMSTEVQTEYERGRADGIAHMRSMADDVLARSIADDLEIEALKARIEDYKRRLAAAPSLLPPSITSMSQSISDSRCLHLWFAKSVTEADRAWLLAAINDKALAAPPAAGSDDWEDDPSADERWNAGVDFAMLELCTFMGVKPHDVNWDAATETVDGDVRAVIGNIVCAKLGDDWSPSSAQPEAGVREALDGEGARRAAEAIFDWADENLSMFEACSEENPVMAKQILDAAKALLAMLNGDFPSAVTSDERQTPPTGE